jgi:uncharacterized membrane protein
MSTFFVTSIDVNVPVRTAYNQWIQFKDFPLFLEGLKELHQLDDRHLHWKAEIGGKEQEGDVEIIEQTPDQRIAWRNQAGAIITGGVVSFQQLSDSRSKVLLQLTYKPEDVVTHVGGANGMVSLHVQRDLERFKSFIESRGRESGGKRAGKGKAHIGNKADITVQQRDG